MEWGLFRHLSTWAAFVEPRIAAIRHVGLSYDHRDPACRRWALTIKVFECNTYIRRCAVLPIVYTCAVYTVVVAREMLVEAAWCAEAIAILACLDGSFRSYDLTDGLVQGTFT